MQVSQYTSQYQLQVKNLVTSVHEEFSFPYDEKLDYDLENPAKYYNNAGGMFLILLDEERVVGTAAVKRINDEIAELKRMYLLPELRGQGWGKKLLNQAITFAKKKNFKKLQLDTNVKQIDAQKLYEKAGFKEYKREKNTIFMSLDLQKSLNQ